MAACLSRSFSGNSALASASSAWPSCQQPIEIDVSLAELLAIEQEVEAEAWRVQLGTDSLVIRPPTGTDQLAWLTHTLQDEATALQTIIRTLIVEGSEVELTQEWLERIEAVLDQHDPLVQCGMSVACPYCQELAQHEVNLAAFAVRQLQDTQAHLIEVVHRLAGYYHWTEADILAIPPWRRARYLALVEREEAS
jgi:hypothetical protein